jgi:N-acetylmuramoyl-L-alanine amidase
MSRENGPIKHIVIHCAATPNGANVTAAQIAAMHEREPKIGRMGYHYVIEIDGALQEGCPVDTMGVHVRGNNKGSLGICMVGTDKFTEAQWATLRDIVNALQMQHPGASVWGHRDFSPDLDGDGVVEPHEWVKICPGFAVDAWRLTGMDVLWNAEHLLGVALA